MAKKPTLSLCMIVKNESDFLKRCLESVKPIVDEIIIVDTGSKDNTIEIAKSFGAKVVKHKWDNNFGKSRNISLKHATKDWILVLDADEIISKKDLKNIKELLEKAESDAFSLVQRNYFKEKRDPTALEVSSVNDKYSESKPYKGWFPSRLVRLFRNNKGYEFTGIIHELVEPSIKQSSGKIEPTKIPIHHFRVEKGKRFDLEKKQKYLEIGEKQIQLTPDDPKAYYEVGTLYLSDEKLDDAITMLEKAVQLIESSSQPQEHINTYGYVNHNLGHAYLKSERYEDAIKCFKKLLKRYPKTPSTHFYLAQAYTMLGRFGEAIDSYRMASQFDPGDAEIHNNLANLYSRTGQFEMAINEFKIALSLSPNNATIHRNLGAAYFGMKRFASAYHSFKRSVELNPEFEKDLKEALQKLETIKDNILDIDYSFSIEGME